MLNTSYSYYGDEIRCINKINGVQVEWDHRLSTRYLTNTHRATQKSLDHVIYDLPLEVQFKIIGDLLKDSPVDAFKLILKYNFKTLFGLSSVLLSFAGIFMICQLIIMVFSNILH